MSFIRAPTRALTWLAATAQLLLLIAVDQVSSLGKTCQRLNHIAEHFADLSLDKSNPSEEYLKAENIFNGQPADKTTNLKKRNSSYQMLSHLFIDLNVTIISKTCPLYASERIHFWMCHLNSSRGSIRPSVLLSFLCVHSANQLSVRLPIFQSITPLPKIMRMTHQFAQKGSTRTALNRVQRSLFDVLIRFRVQLILFVFYSLNDTLHLLSYNKKAVWNKHIVGFV